MNTTTDRQPALPPGYQLRSDGIMDPYYAIRDNDLGEIVTGTHATREGAVKEAWDDYDSREVIMADHNTLNQEDFDLRLTGIVGNASPAELLAIPGIYEALSEHFNNEVLSWWEQITAHPPIVFDRGDVLGIIVFPQHGKFEGNRTRYLDCSTGARITSLWGDLQRPLDYLEAKNGLGRRVTLDELDEATRSHIIARLMEEH